MNTVTVEEREGYKRVALDVLKSIAIGNTGKQPVQQEQQIAAAHTILVWVNN